MSKTQHPPSELYKPWLHTMVLLLMAGLYFLVGYQLDRTDFPLLISGVALLFLGYWYLLCSSQNFNFLLIIGLCFRLIFLFATPNLSQDYYRFIWDGQLLQNGINPYAYTPVELMQTVDFVLPHQDFLYQGMGELSRMHYSNYPPANQLIFALTSLLSFGNITAHIIWLKIVMVLSDMGTLWLTKKILTLIKKPRHIAFLYFLNPLIIIELSGNLHFEGVMIFLFALAAYLLMREKIVLSAGAYAGAVLLKLVPLMLLPLWIRTKSMKSIIYWYGLIGMASLVLILPFFSQENLAHYNQTLQLWFSNFQFNGGFYQLSKTVAVHYFEVKPWLFIADYGTFHKICTLIIILLLAYHYRKSKPSMVFHASLWVLTFYFLLSPTVHPWYLSFLIFLTIFTSYRFPIIWSATVFLSYHAYGQPNFKENNILLFIEYSVVIAYMSFEILKKSNNLLDFREKKPHNEAG